MICKDCIHFSLCDYNTNHSVIIPKVNLFFDKGAEKCPFFKDKFKIIELPCKVGDEVYYILKDKMDRNAINGFIVSEPSKITEIGTRGFWTSVFPNEHPDAMDDFEPWDSIGKTVFLTKESAEQALRERENK